MAEPCSHRQTKRHSTQTRMPPGFKSPRQFAKDIGLSEHAIYTMLRRRQLKHMRVGGRFLIPADEKERLLACEQLE